MLFYSCFPDAYFRSRIERGLYLTQAGQKFQKSLIKGFCANQADMTVLFFYDKEEQESISCEETYYGKTVSYQGYLLKGNTISRSLLRVKRIRQFIAEGVRNGYQYLVVDALNPYAAVISRIARKNGVCLITYITDFVEYLDYGSDRLSVRLKKRLLIREFYKQFAYTDLFVLLTENMKDKIPGNNIRSVVVDGLVDLEHDPPDANFTSGGKTTFVYTGSICKMFGLKTLVQAFINAALPMAELHLYGNGDYIEELRSVCEQHTNVRYFGVVPNEEIPMILSHASFLVNPRPVSDEYNKYSFPSKTMEYLLSGVPTITTRLPSIGDEYTPYLNFFDADDIEGIRDTLIRICQEDYSELIEKARMAKAYISKTKNHQLQCKRIMEKALHDREA